MKKRFNVVALLLCLCFLVCPLSVSAEGEDIDNGTPVAVTIDHPLDGVEFRLYRVADLSGDGAYVTLSGEFARFSEILTEKATTDFFSNYLSILVDYIAYYELSPDTQGMTEEGKVRFENLTPGVYIALSDKAWSEEKEMYYIGTPMMFCAPNRLTVSTQWDYDLEVKGKYELTSGDIKDTWMQVTKRWANVGEGGTHPDKVTVALLCDNQLYEKVELSEANRWTYTWTELSTACNWSVTEVDVPQGYSLSKDTSYANQHILINTKKDPLPPDNPPPPNIPGTGVLWWPVPSLVVLGLALFLVGTLRQRREEE